MRKPSTGPEAAEMAGEIRTLIRPLRQLPPEEIVRAVHVARGLGRAFGQHFERCIVCLAGRDVPLKPNYRAYLTYVIQPSWREAGLPASDFRRWEADFASGAASRDPRVQAFCAGLSEYALEMARAVARSRQLLADFLEVRTERIAVHYSDSDERVVFGHGEERYLVLAAPDAAGTPSQRDAGPIGSAAPDGLRWSDAHGAGAGPVASEACLFLGHRIVRWSAAGPESDGEANAAGGR